MRFVSLADHIGAHWGEPNCTGGVSAPARLFHGSHKDHLPRIMREGLLLSRPGGLMGIGGQVMPERPAVYLASAVPLAREAVRRQHGGVMDGSSLISALEKPPPLSSWEDESILVVDVSGLKLIKSGEFLCLHSIPPSRLVGVYSEMLKSGPLVDHQGHVL